MAVSQARLAKAELLLLGSFARQGEELSIQIRLIRVTDQRILAQATWTDRYAKVLSAPQVLIEKLHANLGRPFDPGSVEGIEKGIPTTIDVARSYYLGLRAFDAGLYPEALAHYLDAAGHAGQFRKAHPAVLEMYHLLDRSDHAVLFARAFAQSLEASGDVSGAVEYYFEAARDCLDPLRDPSAASELLQTLLRLVERNERSTGETATSKRAVLDRIDALTRNGEDKKIEADHDIRDRVWIGDIEAELERRVERQARGGDS